MIGNFNLANNNKRLLRSIPNRQTYLIVIFRLLEKLLNVPYLVYSALENQLAADQHCTHALYTCTQMRSWEGAPSRRINTERETARQC